MKWLDERLYPIPRSVWIASMIFLLVVIVGGIWVAPKVVEGCRRQGGYILSTGHFMMCVRSEETP